MDCGVRFCGGCNSRYDRGAAFDRIQRELSGEAEVTVAEEGVQYDLLLVIGGCTNCCAGYEQFKTRGGVLKMWEENHIEHIIKAVRELESY